MIMSTRASTKKRSVSSLLSASVDKLPIEKAPPASPSEKHKDDSAQLPKRPAPPPEIKVTEPTPEPSSCPFSNGDREAMRIQLSPHHLVSLKEWEKRKLFVNFGPADHEILQELHLVAKTYADEVMEELYSQWLRFPELRQFFKDEQLYVLSTFTNQFAIQATLKRVRELQRRYFIRLTSGEYNYAYLEDRLRIGLVHKRIGLSPQWYAASQIMQYMGAYSIYMQVVFPRVLSAFEYDRKKAHAAISALIKLVSLDQELAMLAYFAPSDDPGKESLEIVRRSLSSSSNFTPAESSSSVSTSVSTTTLNSPPVSHLCPFANSGSSFSPSSSSPSPSPFCSSSSSFAAPTSPHHHRANSNYSSSNQRAANEETNSERENNTTILATNLHLTVSKNCTQN